ncbi:MAG: TylF/MycF/NovP-related O-methyltransferase [Planctomycetota bacterium]
MWMKSRRFQRLGGGRLERLGIGFVSWFQMLNLGGHKQKDTLQLMRSIRRERKSLLLASEAFMLHAIGRAQSQRTGAMAEVGVFEGASAKLLCEVKGGRTLHLFDTFDGLPESTDPDRQVHREKQYPSSLESVREYLKDYDNVEFHRGRFPDSAADLNNTSFSFAHFDVDLYESTLACLEHFYPRMIPGGVMLSHDYSILTGVAKACDEFLEDKPEALIELPTTQCMVIKL